MHGIVHDFVVLNTIKDGDTYPTGNGPATNGKASELLPGFPVLKTQPVFNDILDIGSLDINGSMRNYNYCGAGPKWVDQVGCQIYDGVDLIPGLGVDLIQNAHALKMKDEEYDLVLCLSMLEHDTDPELTIYEAWRVLKKGQPFILTTVSAEHEEHKHLGGGDQETYNHFTLNDVMSFLKFAGFKNIGYRNPTTELLFACIK